MRWRDRVLAVFDELTTLSVRGDHSIGSGVDAALATLSVRGELVEP